MQIIAENFFRKIKDVKLNKDGKIIGSFVSYKNKVFYYTRRTSEHYFVIFNGLGLDKVLLKKMTALNPNPQDLFERVEGIIVFYDGEREKRFYFVDPFDWDNDGIEYSTAKEFEGEIQSYGVQKIYPMANMVLIGLHKDDYENKAPATKKNISEKKYGIWDRFFKK